MIKPFLFNLFILLNLFVLYHLINKSMIKPVLATRKGIKKKTFKPLFKNYFNNTNKLNRTLLINYLLII